MPYSYVDFGSGVTPLTSAEQNGTFAPTGLQYIQTDDLYLTVTDNTGLVTELTSSNLTITETPSLQVVISSGISLPLNETDLVRIGRSTDVDAKARVFVDGSVLKASDLNTQNNQFLYSIQESLDTGTGALPIVTDGTYDAGGRRIKNVGTPINDSDVCTFGIANSLLVYGGAVEPQGWSYTITNFETAPNGTDLQRVLSSPTPASAVNNMYLVEIGGITQIPDTDYTVTEVGTTFTLTLIGAVAQAYGDSTPVMIRNFGAARQILATPYQAETTTDDALKIERISGQTGNLIYADDESDNALFRVDANGQVIIGEDGTYGVTSSRLSTTQMEVGNVDITTSNDPDYFGVKAYTTSSQGRLEILGADPASNDSAVEIYDRDGTGTLTTTLKATYGGALEISGTLTAPTVAATNLNVSGVSTFSNNMELLTNKAFVLKYSTGVTGIQVTPDALFNAKYITMKSSLVPSANADGEKGIYSQNQTGSTYGHIGLTGLGSPFLGMGGSGSGVAFGGPGSFSFEYNGGHRSGPVIRVNNDRVLVTGYKIPTGQGGAAGQNGNNRNTLHIEGQSTADWSIAENNQVMTKAQIDARIPAGHYASHPSTFTAAGEVLVPMVQGLDHFYNPGNNFAYQSANHRVNITQGVWQLKITIPEFGAISNVSTNERLVVKVQDIISSSPPTTVANTSGNGTTAWAFLSNGSVSVPLSSFYRDSPLILNCVVGLFTPGTPPSGSPSGGPLNNANYWVRAIAYTTVSSSVSCVNPHVEFTRVE